MIRVFEHNGVREVAIDDSVESRAADVPGDQLSNRSDESIEGVVVVTLDRPERRNALDFAMLEQLRDQRSRFEAARVIVLTGTPPGFCAGADLNGVDESKYAVLLQQVLATFASVPAIVMAAVDGPALGAGMQLVMAADLRIATPASRFGIPAARLGLVVDHWTVERLAREVGWSIARAMLLGAETFSAERLFHNGTIHRLGDLEAALIWAEELSRLAPLTIAGHKLALEHSTSFGPGGPRHELVEAVRRAAWASRDALEGRTAFLEKRTPKFVGE
jgi:enoyl-CoA hydratase